MEDYRRAVGMSFRTFAASVVVAVALLFVVAGTTTADAATHAYDAPVVTRVDLRSTTMAEAVSYQLGDVRATSASPSVDAQGTSTTPVARVVATEAVSPRDVHGELADADVDVAHVKAEGDLYIQDDGQLVRVLDNGNGTSDVVVYDPSNPSCAPTTKIKNMPNRQVQSRVASGRWS